MPAYAHYFFRAPELPRDPFNIAVATAERVAEYLVKQLKIRITRRADDVEPAVWGIFGIEFAQYGRPDLPRFVFDREHPGDGSLPDNEGRVFDFCETQAAEYDPIVAAVLIVLKHHLGDALAVESEGASTNPQWTIARQACQQVLGYGGDFRHGSDEP